MTISVLSTLLFIPIALYGEFMSDSDSLRLELQRNHADSVKVDILIKLSESRTIGVDSAHFYSSKALEISRSIHYDFGIAQSCNALISFAKSENEIDSLMETSIHFFRTSKRYDQESLVYLKVASRYLTLGDRQLKAFHYANLLLTTYKNNQDSGSFAKAWNIVGEVYRTSKNYEMAMHAYRQAKKFSTLKGKMIFLSPYINIGTIHLELGHKDSAMAYYDFIQAYLINASEEESSTFAYIKYRKAQVFLSQGNLNNALNEVTQGFETYQRLGHSEGKVLTSGLMSEIYLRWDFTARQFPLESRLLNWQGRWTTL